MSHDPLKMPARLPRWMGSRSPNPFWLCAPLDVLYKLDCTSSGISLIQWQVIRSERKGDDTILGHEALRTAKAETLGSAVLIASIWHEELLVDCRVDHETDYKAFSEEEVELA